VVLCSEGATTMDIGGTQMPLENPRSYLNAGSYGTMGVGLGLVVAACVVHPDRPVVHVSGDSAIGFSGMEMETLCRYNMPAKIVVMNNGGIGPGMPEIPSNPMLNMRPNTLIYGARYDKMMQAFGGYGAYVEDVKDVRGALDELMNFPGPAWSTSSSAKARSARPSRSAGTADPLLPDSNRRAAPQSGPFSLFRRATEQSAESDRDNPATAFDQTPENQPSGDRNRAASQASSIQ
jgi:thiamine pyrophosphate-dependent acetolactate synthase large subunit-like protein